MNPKPLLFALALIFACSGGCSLVMAQSYQYEVSKRNICEDVGADAQVNYTMRQQGKDMRYAPSPPNHMTPIYTWGNNYGYNVATSLKDAGMTAWAKCMDNIDRLTRDYNANTISGPLQ